MRGVEEWFGDDVGDPSILEYDVRRPIACSVLHYPPARAGGGGGVLSRNYDFPLDGLCSVYGAADGPQHLTVAPYLVELHPDDAYSSLAMTAYDLFGCLDGINEMGLSVALLGLGDVIEKAGIRLPAVADVGLDELLLPRLLLDTCATVDEARAAIQRHTYSYRALPCHFVIADQTGDCIVFERTISDDDDVFVEGSGVTAVTNHLLHRATPAALTESHLRCEALAGAAASVRGHHDDLARVNRDFFVSPGEREFFGPSERVRTLWHSMYNTRDLTMDVSFYVGDEDCGPGAARAAYSPYRKMHLARSFRCCSDRSNFGEPVD
jgi:hypothetical protein